MTISFPNETPEYRAARDKLLTQELALRTQVEELAKARRALPAGGEIPQDYVFQYKSGDPVSMSDLFNTECLALYSLMYKTTDVQPCPMCASLLDGLNAQMTQLSRSIDLVVVAKATPEMLTDLAASRGWDQLRFVSAEHNSYQRDYRGEDANGAQLPMLNIFERKDHVIRHYWGSEGYFAPLTGHPRHLDTLWPLWNMLDLTPKGRSDFMPQL